VGYIDLQIKSILFVYTSLVIERAYLRLGGYSFLRLGLRLGFYVGGYNIIWVVIISMGDFKLFILRFSTSIGHHLFLLRNGDEIIWD
jgi:hypothetical protein